MDLRKFKICRAFPGERGRLVEPAQEVPELLDAVPRPRHARRLPLLTQGAQPQDIERFFYALRVKFREGRVREVTPDKRDLSDLCPAPTGDPPLRIEIPCLDPLHVGVQC